MTLAIGWTASVILLITLIFQARQQWKQRGKGGASPWLFIGQMLASIGFVTYSMLQGDWVFITTNAVLLIAAVGGVLVCCRQYGGVAETVEAAKDEVAGT